MGDQHLPPSHKGLQGATAKGDEGRPRQIEFVDGPEGMEEITELVHFAADLRSKRQDRVVVLLVSSDGAEKIKDQVAEAERYSITERPVRSWHAWRRDIAASADASE